MTRSVSIFTRACSGPDWARRINGAAAREPAKARREIFIDILSESAFRSSDADCMTSSPRGQQIYWVLVLDLVSSGERRDPASQEPDIQVETPNRGSTHRISAK